MMMIGLAIYKFIQTVGYLFLYFIIDVVMIV